VRNARTTIILAVAAATAGVVTATTVGGPQRAAATAPTVPHSAPTVIAPSAPQSPTRPAVTPSKPATPTAKPTPVQAPALWREGDTGSDVRSLEARLVQLRLLQPVRVDGDYGTSTTTAVRTLQARRGLPVTGQVDAATWAEIQASTRRPTQAELRPTPPASSVKVRLDERCLTGRVLCIDKSTRRLAWVVDGRIIDTVSVRFGSVQTPTREGTFSVYRKSIDHVSNEYGSAMPYAMFFSGGQAVHYSSDFAARGYNGASHGCVNVRDRGAIRAMFAQVRIGDRVVVHRS